MTPTSTTRQKAAVATWMMTLNASGLWPDVDYSNCTQGPDYGFCGDNWVAAEHVYVRLLSMAQVLAMGGEAIKCRPPSARAQLQI